MGEAKRKKAENLASIKANSVRCVYCDSAPTTIEHMPPRGMFTNSSRPKGMEFACCEPCNTGTKTADLVAQFLSRISQDDRITDDKIAEIQKAKNALLRAAPHVIFEILSAMKKTWVPGPGGLLVPRVGGDLNGTLTTRYMEVFAAKLAMAMHYEHTGAPLPMNGRIMTKVFYNAGLMQEEGDAILSIMPLRGTLKQGRWSVPQEFIYHSNTDLNTIVASLSSFRDNLFVLAVTAVGPEYEKITVPGATVSRPGNLVKRTPTIENSPGRSIARL